ncbi:YesL family protein [Metabacillus arenae]|uniref:YesL family protein n=1 Tax=Metabacillus arenae TaxID=2771434 RepID=A0A926NKE2_9BACI|nr:YesL family protein [Metabacillus arenae]MBD1379461.1 YesL family protein [Metabacillus arenae]
MEGNLFITKLNTLFLWVTKLAYLNGLWILFSLIGLVIVGLFPASVAMLTICRKWLHGESTLPIFKTFVKTYKSALLSSNLLGWILAGVGILLYINFLILQANTGQINIVTISAFYLFLVFFLITVSHALPVFVHYRISILNCIRHAFIIGLLNVHLSIAIMISQSSFFYLMFSYPSSAVFFLGSILSIIQMWLALCSFKRIDKRAMKKKSVKAFA